MRGKQTGITKIFWQGSLHPEMRKFINDVTTAKDLLQKVLVPSECLFNKKLAMILKIV